MSCFVFLFFFFYSDVSKAKEACCLQKITNVQILIMCVLELYLNKTQHAVQYVGH